MFSSRGFMGSGDVPVRSRAVVFPRADVRTIVTFWSLLLALRISAAVGILFGIYPAYHAANYGSHRGPPARVTGAPADRPTSAHALCNPLGDPPENAPTSVRPVTDR